jgi:hypothetical protein
VGAVRGALTRPGVRMVGMAEPDMLDTVISAFDLFVVGSVEDSGALILSRDGRTPVDETVVFLATDPEAEMTLTEAESKLGGVTWLIEPEPYDGNPAGPWAEGDQADGMVDVAAMADEWTPMMAAVADPSAEALAAEQQAAVQDVEKRVGQLEGMVAEIMLASVADEAFGASATDVVVVERPMPRFAALGVELAGLGRTVARLAAADETMGEDLDKRLSKVLERLDKLESTIAELMDDKVADDEMGDEGDESDESGTLVDETLPPAKTAAFFTNTRGVRVWHDPNSGKFAPAGFVSLDVLRRLFNGSPEARTEITEALRKARKIDPKLTLADAPIRVLGPRPSDRESGLHWDAAKRSLFSSWRRSTPDADKYVRKTFGIGPDESSRQSVRADRMSVRSMPDGARPEIDPTTGEPSDTDFSVAEFRNGDVNFYLSYAADADEYQLVRSPNDPIGIDEVAVESGKFPMGTSAQEVAATLASRAGFNDFADALDAELTDRISGPPVDTLAADRVQASPVPRGAKPQVDPLTGEPSRVDFDVAEFRNGDVRFYLSYAADADEYQLTRSPNDPLGIDEVGVASGKFPAGTSPEEIAATLADRAAFRDFADALDAELTDRISGPPVDTLAADRMRVAPAVRPMDSAMARVALQQIGTMNVMAISGGRSSIDAEGRLVLPVAAGYRVRVSLAPNDTYTVERVFSRGGVDSVKGRVDTVYDSELGEVAYRASNFRDGPFGPSDSTLMANRMTLVDASGVEPFDVDAFIRNNPQREGEELFAWQGRIVESLPIDVQSEVLFQLRETYDASPRVAAGMERWQQDHGLPAIPPGLSDERADLDEANRAATFYEGAPDASADPEVQAAYADFVQQSEEMWSFLTRPESEGGMGIRVEFTDQPDPYATAEAQRDDIENNGHLWIERGLGGEHSATVSDEEYDRFRAVHDVFGHAGIGSGFDRHGEYQAWLAHAAMYSGLGRRAMSTEYHGVNSAAWSGAPGTPGTGKSVLLPDELGEPPWLRTQQLGGLSDDYLLKLFAADPAPPVRAELVRRGLLPMTAAMGEPPVDPVTRLLEWLGLTAGSPEASAVARQASHLGWHK